MPRNKITKRSPRQRAPKGLPELTEKQLAFVRAILEGKTAADAFRTAYDTSGYVNPAAVWVDACRTRQHPNVVLWLNAARVNAMDETVCTLGSHVAELQRLKEIAIATGNVGAAVLAEHHRGKVAGHYVERFEDVGAGSHANDVVSRIREMLGDAAAAEAERQLGLTTTH